MCVLWFWASLVDETHGWGTVVDMVHGTSLDHLRAFGGSSRPSTSKQDIHSSSYH